MTFVVLYSTVVIFSLLQPTEERGMGLLLALILSFPSSLIVNEFFQLSSPFNYIVEAIAGMVQYAILGGCIDFIRLAVQKRNSIINSSFDDLRKNI